MTATLGRRLVALVALASLTAACSGDDGGAAAPKTTSTTRVRTTTTVQEIVIEDTLPPTTRPPAPAPIVKKVTRIIPAPEEDVEPPVRPSPFKLVGDKHYGVDGWATFARGDRPQYKGNGVASDVSIVKDGGRYLMYHTCIARDGPPELDEGFRAAICVATSPDGDTWTMAETGDSVVPGRVVGGRNGKWDERIEAAFVLRTKDAFLLYYGGYTDEPGSPPHVEAGGFPASMGLARSTDGIHFERVQDEPIFEGTPGGPDWDAVYSPTITERDGTYHMVYAGHCYSACAPLGVRIMGATSTDGVHWDKRPEPVLESRPSDPAWMSDGVAEPGYVKGDDGYWYLFFTGLGMNESRTLGVLRGKTPFGPWEGAPALVLGPRRGTFENEVLAPDLRVEGDRVRMWFLAHGSDDRFFTGYAEAHWPLKR